MIGVNSVLVVKGCNHSKKNRVGRGGLGLPCVQTKHYEFRENLKKNLLPLGTFVSVYEGVFLVKRSMAGKRA